MFLKLAIVTLLFLGIVSCSEDKVPPVNSVNNDDTTTIITDKDSLDTLSSDDSTAIEVPENSLFSVKTIAFADSLVAIMSLDEKIGQMTQGERDAVSPEDVKEFMIGSILSGGGSTPKDNTPDGWCDMYDAYQNAAITTGASIPLIYGIDAVHGHNNAKGAVIFPHNIGLGCANDPELIERASYITSKEVSATGLDWDFAPCITVPQDIRWGRTYEGYSEDPAIVASLGAAAVRGYQKDLNTDKSIAACAKHFVGDGGTIMGTGHRYKVLDRGNVDVDLETLKAIHMKGYVDAIEAGVLTVMASYSSYKDEKCHGSKYLLTDLLKGELGFEGYVISDWEAIHSLEGDYKEQVKVSINAGIDQMMEPTKYKKFISTLKELVEEGSVEMSRIDDAVSRILKVKHKMGLFANPLADRSLIADFGSDEHREVARECVRKSLVLLQNDADALPLKDDQNIAVIGLPAKNSGYQCGGWTESWQGSKLSITGATSLLDALNNKYGSVTYSEDGSDISSADVAIFVLSENPYAEFDGDTKTLSRELSEEQLASLETLKKSGAKIVTVIYSGRPVVIPELFENSDAVVAAWLPGSEADGIVDVLSGAFDFSGKLSFSWPASMETVPVTMHDIDYNPLYKVGFGLNLEK